MASIAVPFSGLPNHRFEVSANVIDVTATDYFVRIRSTIRRTSGTGTGVQGNGEHSYGINGPGGGAGGESPVPYNLTTAIAQEFPDQVWQLPASLWSPGDVATLNSSYVASTGPLGSADSGPLAVTLPPLSQVTYPTLPISVEAGAVLNIDLPRKSADYTHDLFYSIGAEQNISIQTGAGASATWAVPMSLLQQIPNAPTGTLTITAITRDSEGRSLGQASSTTIMTVPASAKPTITGYELSDAGVPSNYPPVEAWIQTLSVLKVDSITATASYGATIVQARLLIEGASIPVGGTRTLLNAGTIPYTVRVWDSRGSFSDVTASAVVLNYFQPILQQYDVFRADSAGNPLEDGEYLVADIQALRSELFFPNAPTTDVNTFALRIQTRELGTTTWTDRNVIDYPSPPLFDQAVLISGGGIYLNTKSYEVRLYARDISALSLSVQGPADRVVATGLVSIDVNGTNVGIGKTWANGKLDVDGDVYTEGKYYAGAGMALGYSGTTAQRNALPASVRQVGTRWRTTDTTPFLNWEWTGSTWLLVPGQVLAVAEGPTGSTTGAAGTVVVPPLSTATLPVGQRVKISASYSQYATAAGGNPIALQARNNASNVSYTTFDVRTVTRGYSPAAGTVADTTTPVVFLTTTVAAKVSAAIYLWGATSGVYGADGTWLWIESA